MCRFHAPQKRPRRVQPARHLKDTARENGLLESSHSHDGRIWLEPRRKWIASIVVFLLALAASRPAPAYSVFTHEELIDLTWADSIRPLLLQRYPGLTEPQLREARANAYGGCVIQDLGYYPFGNQLFSDLLHYVRTGDFIRSLFRNAKNANETAFAIGALSHYYGDTIGHPEAINLAVGKEFPQLAAKYGPNVNYSEGPHQHVRSEFAFDVDDIVKQRMPPEGYLNHAGFEVPMQLLSKAFYETYGLRLSDFLGKHRPTMRGYSYSVRTLLPRVAYAETLLYRKRMPPDVTTPQLAELKQQVAALSAAEHWSRYRSHAGFGTHILAGVIFIIPKFGALSDLKLRTPTNTAEQDYVKSLLQSADVLRETLAGAASSGKIPNKDLDTGDMVYPGTYPLEDYAYADLLHRMTRNPASSIPFGIKRDLQAYFSDLGKVKYLQEEKSAKRLAQVQADLPVLQTIPTNSLEADGPLLADEAAQQLPEAGLAPKSPAPPASAAKP